MDNLVKRSAIENRIRDFVWNTNKNSVLFDYKTTTNNFVSVDVITINNKTERAFLLDSGLGNSDIQALNKVIESLEANKPLTYKVMWYKPGQNLTESHFKVTSYKELYNKIFFDKNDNEIIVKSTELLPQS